MIKFLKQLRGRAFDSGAVSIATAVFDDVWSFGPTRPVLLRAIVLKQYRTYLQNTLSGWLAWRQGISASATWPR